MNCISYANLIEKSNKCTLKAIHYFHNNDMNMVAFYKNASIGYREKALKMRLQNG